MADHLHHIHVYASNVDESVRFYREHFGAKVVMDTEIAGARNVLMRIGNGRLCIDDRPPKHTQRGPISYFAIQTDDIEKNVERLAAKGVSVYREITDLGYMKYIMIFAPDNVVIEYFQVNKSMLPEEYASFFE